MLSFRGLRVCQRSLSGEWLEQRKLLSSMSLSNMESKNCRRDIDVSRLAVVNKIGTPSTMPPLEDLKFGQFYSDHFLDVEWDDVNGWRAPMILPLQCIQMHPGSSALHYGLQIFEGMKAYKNARGEVLLFRPDLNMARLNKSARRMALPEFDETEMLRLIARLLKVDERFIPEKDGFSAYIRPVMYSTHGSLGVAVPRSARLNVLISPCGPYYPTGFKPVQLLAESKFTRAFPGGAGDCKVGGNYGPTVYPQGCAAAQGFSQLLWLFPLEDDHILTEAGTMNLFVLWINSSGDRELVTPPLDRNLILPGITRDTVLQLAREWNEFKVSERDILMKREFIKALEENRVSDDLAYFSNSFATCVS
eukprot:GHVQ01036371.1.p1 GENE.GHVQ01036371.1~~GHVQ01036371.1.p1  ORF type:complete len:363 (+),score=39.84 GHVQ01036371.1:240-1328(+)